MNLCSGLAARVLLLHYRSVLREGRCASDLFENTHFWLSHVPLYTTLAMKFGGRERIYTSNSERIAPFGVLKVRLPAQLRHEEGLTPSTPTAVFTREPAAMVL